MRQKPDGSTKGGRTWNFFGRKGEGKGEQSEGGGGKASSNIKRDHYFHFREANSMAKTILRVAQELGVVGVGIEDSGESWEGLNNEAHFFNEVMEFSWPPESKLIEQDCTCEMWNKIKYKY